MADYEREAVAALKAIAKELEGIRREMTILRRELKPAENIQVVTEIGPMQGIIPMTDDLKKAIEEASKKAGI